MDKKNLDNLRHSCAHLLAAAVMEIWPDTKRAIGPAIENGFYFDFDFGDKKISEDDFARIENKMHEIAKSWKSFERHEMSADKAKDEYPNNPYKHELIEEFSKKGETLSFYKSGDYWDLCRGGHCEHPDQELKHFKLLSIAGAYWRGSEKNPMLTRIYGTIFPTKAELDDYLKMLEEAKKRDHKKLGQALSLFVFHETSPGMPYWLPKGLIVYNELLSFSRQVHKDFGYQEVATPILNKKELYETSGHWDHYRDDMFVSPMSYLRGDSKEALIGTETFGIKPMNCPNAMTIFSLTTRSYRDLPMRLSETSALHRFELSGTLNGLFRAREFHQDDAHIFISMDQLASEFGKIMEMIDIFYSAFNLEYRLRFGTRPENFMGDKKDWDEAEESLEKILAASGKEYVKEEGEGAFYGPKIDILMKDSIGREWQTGTIQLDFQQPKNFKLAYTDSSGNDAVPAAIHRAIYGSFERFIGILTEHFMGAFPMWLAPIQVAVLPVSDKTREYSQAVVERLKNSGIRVEFDDSDKPIGAKIREATLQKVPAMCIIGEKEKARSEGNSDLFVSVRSRDGSDLGTIEIEAFLKGLKEDIEKRK
ncbi:MAG TPA: threonine--tRNA ligase [Patescibacteria group bacterium]|nr:threonine--tRNA ligase [Patescibacteria group bacterium]